MVTSEERMRILRMVEEGKISPDEAARLLEALGRRDRAKKSPKVAQRLQGRWLRVRVYDRNGAAKVNVNLPLRLVDVGLSVAERFLPGTQFDGVAQALSEALQEGLEGKIVDVVDEEDGERVEIFIE